MEAEKNLPYRTLVVRSGQVVGPHDYSGRLPYWVHRMKQGGDVIAPGDRKRQVQIIDVRDLASWGRK
ncbi:NAD-dependent epimerase/dehydratase family protein [Geomicrobium sp. JSM 1781026]|uniref:NAD-dependent epimerase/dehydratase family protein n=1 Tax=Geomicrobium sp. JSM 1781026 TaxID=3344580 RepID=UPI0035C1CBC4